MDAKKTTKTAIKKIIIPTIAPKNGEEKNPSPNCLTLLTEGILIGGKICKKNINLYLKNRNLNNPPAGGALNCGYLF